MFTCLSMSSDTLNHHVILRSDFFAFACSLPPYYFTSAFPHMLSLSTIYNLLSLTIDTLSFLLLSLALFLCVCVSLYLSLSLPLYLSVFVTFSISLCVCISLYFCSPSLPNAHSLSLSIYLSLSHDLLHTFYRTTLCG